jgi:hypothetical protein
VSLRIDDGVITQFADNAQTDAWHGEGGGLDMFYVWMVENYPDEERAENFYYNYTDEANLDFWKQYIPLLLASPEASS